MQHARVLLPARLPCQVQPAPYALDWALFSPPVLLPGSGGALRSVRSVADRRQWSHHHGRAMRGIYCGILLLLKESQGPGGGHDV
jgi:hypothetical protein